MEQDRNNPNVWRSVVSGASFGLFVGSERRIREGSHSGLVRPPAKRLSREIGIVGSNPTPSAVMPYLEAFSKSLISS